MRRKVCAFLLRQRDLPTILLWVLLGHDSLSSRQGVPQTPSQGRRWQTTLIPFPLVDPLQRASYLGWRSVHIYCGWRDERKTMWTDDDVKGSGRHKSSVVLCGRPIRVILVCPFVLFSFQYTKKSVFLMRHCVMWFQFPFPFPFFYFILFWLIDSNFWTVIWLVWHNWCSAPKKLVFMCVACLFFQLYHSQVYDSFYMSHHSTVFCWWNGYVKYLVKKKIFIAQMRYR